MTPQIYDPNFPYTLVDDAKGKTYRIYSQQGDMLHVQPYDRKQWRAEDTLTTLPVKCVAKVERWK